MGTLGALEFRPTRWVVADAADDLERDTTAYLRIAADGRTATRVSDEFSASLADDVLVALYPLATWLAASWWRLLWEPGPRATPPTAWRLNHELRSAGAGYLWPILRIEPEDDDILLTVSPSAADSREPVRFLASFESRHARSHVEQELGGFIDTVCARLEATGHPATELAALWAEVRTERGDAGMAAARRFEARLGYEPDEAIAQVLERFRALEPLAGVAAVEELAAAHQGEGSAQWLEALQDAVESDAFPAKPAPPRVERPAQGTPGARGAELARRVRTAVGLGGAGAVPDQVLADLVGVPVRALASQAPRRPLRAGVAVRDAEGARVVFRRTLDSGRRFEAARLVGDSILEPAQPWLPSTDAQTARQKRQRAFAAEFLAPIGAITGSLRGDFSGDTLEELAHELRVGPMLIAGQLASHGYVDRDGAHSNA